MIMMFFSTYCTEDDTSRVSKRLHPIGSFAIGLYRNVVAEEMKKSNQPLLLSLSFFFSSKIVNLIPLWCLIDAPTQLVDL